jgi:integrase
MARSGLPQRTTSVQYVSKPPMVAKALKAIIETDLLRNTYDNTLEKYKQLLHDVALQDSMFADQIHYVPPYAQSATPLQPPKKPFELLAEFNNYLGVKGIRESHIPVYYYYTRQMLRRWGAVELDAIPALLSNEPISNRTFNDRRNCLFKFFEWCERKEKIAANLLADVATKKRPKAIDQRKPFTDSEAVRILEALRCDTYSKSTGFPHSQYWRFVAFLLHTGTRNGEAIGLKIKDVDLEHREIRIAYSLSRTRQGSHIGARVLKGTKMENERILPLDDYLLQLLEPICLGRSGDDFVFVNRNGNAIDDRMFQRRILKPLLSALQIQHRDLYACRHTFATRAVRQGLRPHEVAYLMGDSVEMVLSNYFHNQHRPGILPAAIWNIPSGDRTLPGK